MMESVVTLLLCVLSISHALPVEDNSWRVVGGVDAAPGEAPYLVILLDLGRFNCGGIIISKRSILTAAHCVSNIYSNTIVAGTNTLSSGGTTYKVQKIIIHENVGSPTSFSNDIALMILEEDIVFTSLIQPIELDRNDTQTSRLVTLFGWGRTGVIKPPSEYLQKVDLRTISHSECQSYHGNMITTTMICTLTKIGEGACHGDSGGPIVSEDGKLVGVVSWGNPCALGRPDVYSRVSSFIEWIMNNADF